MNRRGFLKWAGRLLAAIPFVALADLEPDPEPAEVPFKIVPADGTIYTTTHPTGVSVMAAYSGSTGINTDMPIAFVRLSAGQAGVTEFDIFDAREPFRPGIGSVDDDS